MIEQIHIFGQRLDRQPGSTHALDKSDAPDIEFVVIPDAVFTAINARD
jgi:hypothetical protein